MLFGVFAHLIEDHVAGQKTAADRALGCGDLSHGRIPPGRRQSAGRVRVGAGGSRARSGRFQDVAGRIRLGDDPRAAWAIFR